MTRPIYEPTTPRTISAQGYTNRQLLRRPSPPQAAGTSAATMYDIDFENIGDSVVAADTWEQITDGSNGRFFTQAWRRDGDWTLDFDGAGNIGNNTDALYMAWVGIEIGNAVNGDEIGAAIQFQVSNQFFYPNNIKVVGGTDRVECTASWFGALNNMVRFWVYTNPSRDISRAELFVRRYELTDDGEFVFFP